MCVGGFAAEEARQACKGWRMVGSKSDRLPAREDEATTLPAAEVISLEKARAFSPGSGGTEEERTLGDGTIECIIV